MKELQAPKPRVVLVVFVPTRCVKNVVRIIWVYVETVVMCALDVARLVTKFETVLSQVPKVSTVLF